MIEYFGEEEKTENVNETGMPSRENTGALNNALSVHTLALSPSLVKWSVTNDNGTITISSKTSK